MGGTKERTEQKLTWVSADSLPNRAHQHMNNPRGRSAPVLREHPRGRMTVAQWGQILQNFLDYWKHVDYFEGQDKHWKAWRQEGNWINIFIYVTLKVLNLLWSILSIGCRTRIEVGRWLEGYPSSPHGYGEWIQRTCQGCMENGYVWRWSQGWESKQSPRWHQVLFEPLDRDTNLHSLSREDYSRQEKIGVLFRTLGT